MAAALLGKCIGFLAVVFFLYSCYAFKIREHGVSTSAELQHRATCAANFGRCAEKISRKWHDTQTQRLASIRKPPAEVTLSDDDTKTERVRGKLERIGRPTDRVVTKSVEVDDDDEEDAIVEVEEDTAEIDTSDDGIITDSDIEDSGGKLGEEDDDEKEDKWKKSRKIERKSEEDDEEEEDDEVDLSSEKDDTRDKYIKNFKGAKKVTKATDKEEEDEKKKHLSIEKYSKERSPRKQGKTTTEEINSVDDEDEEDTEEDTEEDDEEFEVVTTPPPRKLEKVRHADKDKVRSAEIPLVLEKPKVEVKKPTPVLTKKQEETAKKVDEATKKPAESTKKVEIAKTAKSESESSKAKSTSKSEDRTRVLVKSEVSKVPSVTKEKSKQPEKAKVETVNVQSVPAKHANVKRSDKNESKSKTKTHVDSPYTLAQLNDAILRVPTFVPNFTAVEDFECQQHGKIFLRQLRGYKLWALQMLDANAKISSGLLRGNVNQFGDFDECLGVLAHVKLNESTVKVQGKYCLAQIDMYPSLPDMKIPVHMMQSRGLLRGNMRDHGHFIPNFLTAKWALCLPAACSAEQAKHVLEQALSDYNSTTGIKFTVDVDPNMCYVKQKSRTYSKETIGVLYFYAVIICLVLVATVRDYLVVSQGKGNYSERIIMAFSLRRTVKILLKQDTSKSEISCIHGIRAVATFMIYISHVVVPLSMIPFINRIELTEATNMPISSILRVAFLYTEAFLLISGVLTAYNMTHEYIVRGEIRWFCRFISRYARLTPILVAVVFWYAFVMEYTGSGPQWNNIIIKNAELCKRNAWTNLLYIQNFFPFEEMCASHTHHLASDMQLSLLAPMLVFFLEIKPIIGILLIFFFILLSATLRYIAMMNNYLSLVIFHGISNKHLFRTANLTYILSLHRSTPYVLGVGLGVLLRHTGKEIKIHKVLVILGWLIAMALGSWSLFSPWHLSRRDYVYNVEEATNYGVISPVLWALALCWFIFACYTNNGGIINRFLSNYWLLIFSRISYAVYLTQFAVFFYNVGTTRYAAPVQLHKLVDPLEALVVLIISTILTLFFDFPMQEVKSVLMECTDPLNTEAPSKEKPTEEVTDKEQKPAIEERKAEKDFEDDEVASTGWDWQKDIISGGKKLDTDTVDDEEQVTMPILKKSSGRRRSFIDHPSVGDESIIRLDKSKEFKKRLYSDDDQYGESGRRSRSGQRDYQDSGNEDLELSRIQWDREESVKRRRRSVSAGIDGKRRPTRDSDEEEEYSRGREDEEDPRRYWRSQSRGRSVIRESDDYHSWEFVGKELSSSRGSDSKRHSSKSEEHEPAQRQIRPPLSRSSDVKRVFSSESEDEISQRKKVEKRHPSVEPRISDEEDWENELRIRRKQFMEKLTMQQQTLEGEVDLNSLKRRSSAEGKIALLKDPSTDDNMDSWTVSVGSRSALLGSPQERSETEEDNAYVRRREYRERAPPLREDTHSEEEVIWDASGGQSYSSSSQKTSFDGEEDVSSYNFVLTKDSKRISLQDLSKMSMDDSNITDSGWNIVNKGSTEALPKSTSTGLYKRESIIKSQASVEDPEYLLPERPKLVQQEREHPFKKEWQMQKSRSEEDSSAYVIKEVKDQSKTEAKPKSDDFSPVRREASGEQCEDIGSLADDESESITLSQSRSTDTEEARARSKSVESESVFERSKSTSIEDNKVHSKSDVEEDTSKFNWPAENEQYEVYKTSQRSKSEETDWSWEQEET